MCAGYENVSVHAVIKMKMHRYNTNVVMIRLDYSECALMIQTGLPQAVIDYECCHFTVYHII